MLRGVPWLKVVPYCVAVGCLFGLLDHYAFHDSWAGGLEAAAIMAVGQLVSGLLWRRFAKARR